MTKGCSWFYPQRWPHNARGLKKKCGKSCQELPSCKRFDAKTCKNCGGMDEERWWVFAAPPSIPGTHDKSKCREKGELDEDCCAEPGHVDCADGYQVKFLKADHGGPKKCGKWNQPWTMFECLKPGLLPSPPKDEKK